jgi:hypothetical protein
LFVFQKAKLFHTKDNGIGKTFMIYLGESWNKLDVLCVFMYVVSIIFECFNTKLSLNAARFGFFCHKIEILISLNRAFLAVDVVLWFMRLLILLMIDRTVGPMLLMIQAMVGLVCVFI